MRLSTRACVAALIVLAALAPAVRGQTGTWEERLNEMQQQLLDRARNQQPLNIGEFNLKVGEFRDLFARFDAMATSADVTAARTGLSDHAWSQFLGPQGQVAETERDQWFKLIAVAVPGLSAERRAELRTRVGQLAESNDVKYVSELLADPVDLLPWGWQDWSKWSLDQLLAFAQNLNSREDTGRNQLRRSDLSKHVWATYLAKEARVQDADPAKRNALAKALGRTLNGEQWQELLLRLADEPQATNLAEVLNVGLGDFVALVRQFQGMPDGPQVAKVRSQLAQYSTQQYLSSEAQIAAADQENWIKLVETLASTLTDAEKRAVALRLAQFVQPEVEISSETRQSRVKLLLSLEETLTTGEKYELALTLAKTAQPSDVATLLSDDSAFGQADAEVPPLATGFSAEQLAAVAAALDARYLADPAALGGLDFKEMTYLWAALGRCGRDKTQLSDMVAACVHAAEAWRSWGRDDVGRVLVYLKWSSSEAAQSAKVKVADLCIEREIYRFGDDPMLAARAGASLDAMLVSHLRGKLVTPAGDVSPVPAAVLSWYYTTTDPAARAAWEAEVQQRMEDPALAGDRKAGWLLARAYAGAGGSKFMPLKVDRLLQEVMAVAESEVLRLQAVELMVHGYVLFDLFDHATSLLDSVDGQFSDPQSQARLTSWREVIPPRRAEAEAVRLAVEKEAKAAHRKVLEERLKQARQANDQERIARYQRLLEQQQP